MLRRIKRDVEVELGEKIEKEVYCELALRQRAMYQTIKETLRLDDRLFSTDKPPQSLMNILMQFRKVNPPFLTSSSPHDNEGKKKKGEQRRKKAMKRKTNLKKN